MLRATDKRRATSNRLEDALGNRLYANPNRIRRHGPVGVPLCWYDAADAASITTVSDAVSQWNDKMGSFNATQGTAGNRPLYGGAGARSINGIVVPEWVTNDFLDSGAGRSSRTQTAFVVGLSDITITNATMLGINTASGGNQFRFNTATPSGRLETVKEGTATLGTSLQIILATDTPFIACQQLTASTISHWLSISGICTNSKETLSDSTTFTAARTLRIGVRVTTEGWNGLMAEIIIYDSSLSDTDIAKTMEYLADKWGIARVATR